MDLNVVIKALIQEVVREEVKGYIESYGVVAESAVSALDKRLSMVEAAFTAGPDDGFVGMLTSLNAQVQNIDDDVSSIKGVLIDLPDFYDFAKKDEIEEAITDYFNTNTLTVSVN